MEFSDVAAVTIIRFEAQKPLLLAHLGEPAAPSAN
jgi:hypothetical protein